MKSKRINKIAQAMALFMIVSILVPVIAFGAAFGFQSYSYDKTSGTVTATVYSDEYESAQGTVYLNVYAPDGTTVLKTVYEPFSTNSVSGVTYLTFNTSVNSNVYDAVYLQADYNSNSERVYSTDANPDPIGGGGGWGGGYIPPTTPDESLDIPASGDVNADILKTALADHLHVELVLAGDVVFLPARALMDAIDQAGSMITIVSDNGSYSLPLNVLDLEALAELLEIEIEDLIIEVSITKVNEEVSQSIDEAAQALGGTVITDAVNFQITAIGNDGEEAEVNNFDTYVSRTLHIDKAVDFKKTTGILYNENTKKLSFVPSTFVATDGETIATLKRNTNSIYTVVEFDKSFSDITSHWAQEDVTLLANKLVVDGVTDTSFEPERSISRAEFAALIVRSLGFDAEAVTAIPFHDVSAADWYAGVVATAASLKIIDGYEDGSFKPDASITREELAAMVVRALKYAGVKKDLSASQQAALLSKFTDANLIIWGQQEIAAAIDAGIINGLTDTTIGSDKQATRAESATMLKRFLTKTNFIN